MAKLSVLVPARNEKYLVPTIRDVLTNARGEVEVVAVLEGYWPDGWAELCAQYPNLHTIHHSEPKGMRPAINAAAASAISRGAKYLLKLDAHCMVGEGFDVVLQADIDRDWIVVPRRKRLDAENWKVRDDGRPDIDYHYLSFPDDPNDFGGPGLNGKVWAERAKERFDKPEYEIDDEMSSQGSGWFMHADYFQRMGFMDTEHYGPFWNEFQELGLSCWLSGGQVKVNKKTWYAHWHKGSAGRGYNLPKDWLNTGARFTKRWLFNEASKLQTLPFSWLVGKFWPIPTWPENWEELVYGKKGAVPVEIYLSKDGSQLEGVRTVTPESSLTIHSAHYGIGGSDDLDVREQLQSLVQNGSLDLSVTNDSLNVGNPFRGQKKRLLLTYSYDGGEPVTVERAEREWLIIGQSAGYVKQIWSEAAADGLDVMHNKRAQAVLEPKSPSLMSPTALTDLLIRRFKIPDRRLRGPMPIDLREFHRNDLAKLFAELGFTKGVEVGVAEGHYSEVLCKSIPNLELLCVDPWHRYSGNPWAHSQEHQDFSKAETERKLKGYNAKLIQDYSMNAVRDVPENSLDFCYIDGNHFFDYAMGDLIEWSKRVRSGGIVALDDFYHFKRTWGGVVEAVQAYTNAHKITLWFAIDAPQSVDVFWVRP